MSIVSLYTPDPEGPKILSAQAGNGTSNLEQIKRAKQIINAVGRPIVTGAEAIEYLDIPYAATRPGA